MPEETVSRNTYTYPDRFPPITDLGFDVTYIDNKKLGGAQRETDLDNAKFNGCIYQHKDKLLMSYRAYSDKLSGSSNIFISELDKDTLEPIAHHELDLPTYSKTIRQYEDARLFSHKGELYCSYVCVEYIQGRRKSDGKPISSNWWTCIQVVKLDDNFSVVGHYVTEHDGNFHHNAQKNWIYFSDGESLYLIDDTKRHRVLKLDGSFQVLSETHDRPIVWPYGLVRGGTTPLRLEDDLWLAFFHSSIVNYGRKRRYSMTPYLFTRTKLASIGRTIFASTENPIVDAKATWWHPIVIFPMGLVRDGDDLLLSAGVNDISTAIMRIPLSWAMEQNTIENYRHFHPRYLYWEKATNYNKFTHYKILKIGGMCGTILKGHVDNPDDFAELFENYHKIEWVSKEQYEQL